MKILYISQWFSSSGGGGEVLFIEFASEMAKRGHSVHVLTHKDSSRAGLKFDNIYIHEVKPGLSSFPPSYFQNIGFILNATWIGLRIIKNYQIDLIHCNNFSPIIVGTLLSKLCNKPLIKTVHVVFAATSKYWSNWSKQTNVSRFSSIIGPLFEKLTIRLPADIIHTVSKTTKENLVRFGARSKIILVPNIVNLSSYDKLNLKKSYGDYILFIGRLVFNKNLNVLIESFVKVVQKVPNAKLIVVGTGPMLQIWKKMVRDLELKDRIIFTGYVGENEKMDLTANTSAFVLPSINEGMPTVVLEAFAMSTPVIVSDIQSHREIVDDGVDGFLIPLDDKQKWAEKIIYILTNREVCKKMGCNGRAKVEKQFSSQIAINKLESIYKELIH